MEFELGSEDKYIAALNKQIDELKIPSLEDYLSTKYATTANKVTCEYCQRGFKNKDWIIPLDEKINNL